jgi:hypothetical protein
VESRVALRDVKFGRRRRREPRHRGRRWASFFG